MPCSAQFRSLTQVVRQSPTWCIAGTPPAWGWSLWNLAHPKSWSSLVHPCRPPQKKMGQAQTVRSSMLSSIVPGPRAVWFMAEIQQRSNIETSEQSTVSQKTQRLFLTAPFDTSRVPMSTIQLRWPLFIPRLIYSLPKKPSPSTSINPLPPTIFLPFRVTIH